MTAIGQELVALKDRKDGMIHVDRVHSWARQHRNSAISQSLEWDDAKAGYQHRLDQIRNLVQLHVVFAETNARSTVSLAIDRAKKGGGYRELASVLPSPSLRLSLVMQILAEVERVVGRYPQLHELDAVTAAIAASRRAIEAQIPEAAD